MDWKLLIEVAGLLAGLVSFSFVCLRKIDSRFDSMDKSQAENYHNIDKRMHGIEMVVSPYQKDIRELKENQQSNILKLQAVEHCQSTLKNDIDRIQRQLDTLQARKP